VGGGTPVRAVLTVAARVVLSPEVRVLGESVKEIAGVAPLTCWLRLPVLVW
jgi:hypothetical protein